MDGKKYQIIYADPPWPFKTYSQKGQTKATGSVLAHYSTMSFEEICNLPVQKICADDCILFLWVTMPTLDRAFEVIKSWGFIYKTCAFTWVKQNQNGTGIFSGLGHWTKGNAELCLLATKKSFPKRVSRSVRQIVMSPRRRHSRKPDEVRNLILQLTGDIPRIELFAREKPVGWDVWGNEVICDVDLYPTKQAAEEALCKEK